MASRQSAVDIRLAASARTRVKQLQATLFEGKALREGDLRTENGRLAAEIDRLRQENDDLRESAEIWIRLYENQLSRANRAAELLAHCANALGNGSSREEPHIFQPAGRSEPAE